MPELRKRAVRAVARDYAHVFEPKRQLDVNAINEKIMGMAREIARRERLTQHVRIMEEGVPEVF